MSQPKPSNKRDNLVMSVANNFAKTCSANKMTLLEASIAIGIVVGYYSKQTGISIDEIQAVITDMAKSSKK